MVQLRQTAYKTDIYDLINGEYVVKEGWEPNVVVTKKGLKISRVNIIGVVVSKPPSEGVSYNSVVLDDGAGKISVRSFEKNKDLDGAAIGDIVLVVGRPRFFGREIYIIPEIMKKIEDKGWVKVRKLELGLKSPVIIKEEVKGEKEKKEENIEIPAEGIIELIKFLDTGEGADIDDVIKNSKLKEAEKIIDNLLKQGDVFEVKPGKIKVLE